MGLKIYNMKKKIFSIARLTIGDVDFTLQDFSSIESKYNEELEEKKQNRIIKKELFNDDRFISLYFEEGNVNPRPDQVHNTKTHNEENNPRTPDQIERNSQSFFLIDIQDQKIFISDFRKKKMLVKWLSEKIQKQVLIRNIIDKSEFLNKIQSVNKIYLSAVPNLFNQEGILGKELTNDHHNYGVGIKHIGVQIKFEESESLPKKLKNKLTDLFNREVNELFKLEVSGRYDDKFERVFNAEGIIDKIEIQISPERNGLFISEKVFKTLIEETLK